jgi:hypothetical protein
LDALYFHSGDVVDDDDDDDDDDDGWCSSSCALVRRRYPDTEAPFFNILAQPFDMK